MKRLALLVWLFVGLLIDHRALGFILVQTSSGRTSLLSASHGKLTYQSCGNLYFGLADAELEDLSQRCRQASAEAPYSVSESDYTISVQSLFGVPFPYTGMDSVSRLSREAILAQRAGWKQPLEEIRQKLNAAQLELLTNLGTDDHRVLSPENDGHGGRLFRLIYDAMLPAYFENGRFWMLANATTSANLDDACPKGWVMASLDVILNSPSFAEIILWLTRQGKGPSTQVLTWYRWNEAMKYPEVTGFTAKEQALRVVLAEQARAWRNQQVPLMPQAHSQEVTLNSLPGISGKDRFVYPVSASDPAKYRPLCTRKTPPLDEQSEVNEETKQTLLGIAQSFHWSVPQLIRKTSPIELLEDAFSHNLSPSDAEHWRVQVQSSLGFTLKSAGQAKRESDIQIALNQARSQLFNVEQTMKQASQRVGETLQGISDTARRVQLHLKLNDEEFQESRRVYFRAQEEYRQASPGWNKEISRLHGVIQQLEAEQRLILSARN